MIRSSAKRDRWLQVMAHQKTVSTAKSRSDTASIELGQTPPIIPSSCSASRAAMGVVQLKHHTGVPQARGVVHRSSGRERVPARKLRSVRLCSSAPRGHTHGRALASKQQGRSQTDAACVPRLSLPGRGTAGRP